MIPGWWKPWAWLAAGVVLLFAGWGVYKMSIADHAVKDAQLAKDYHDQKDSTEAWKATYKKVEDARKHMSDSVDILSGIVQSVHTEANKWHDSATAAKNRLIVIRRPLATDSTNPAWMHRTMQLETIVASQDREIANKDTEISLRETRTRLLLSQLSKDSVALYSANGNIDRLNKLVEGYKAKSECKFAWFLPCLSRTQSAIAGGLATGIGTVLVNRSRKK